MRGPILLPEDSEYDRLRFGWNGMIERQPLVIARCLGVTDVVEIIRFAQERNVPMTVRAGGHSASGKCVMDGAVMLDLSLMKHVQVDPMRRRAVAHAGATWGDFDRQAQAHGLATTGGVISTTGIAGLTLGGGIGWLMGKYALACDNLVSADVVDVWGQRRTASAEENPDLFWAIRGGGGNFGVVTTFEYELHPLESVYGGVLLYPRPHALDLLRHYRDLTTRAPDELTVYASLMSGPDGTPLAGLALCHCGANGAATESDVAAYRGAAPVIADMVSWRPYAELQTMLDFTAPKGLRYYFKCAFLTELTDEALRTIVHYGESAPSPQTGIMLEHIHGSASRVPADATAFALRRDQYSLNIVPAWQDPRLTERCIAWARAFAAEMERFGTGDAYVNYLGDEGAEAVHATYSRNYKRLSQLKLKYDPGNFFRFNQNILPQ
jgi:FAD/FMN-containing dehydrogenase